MAGAAGMLGKLGIDGANPVTKRFDFKREDLKMQEELRNANGTRGTLSHDITRVRQGKKPIGGSVMFEPNKVEWELLLPWILGTAATGSGPATYALSDVLLSRYVTIDRISKVFTYAGAAVDTATLTASQGTTLMANLNLVALTETVGNSGTFPAINIDTATGPFIFEDLTLTINSTSVQAKEFELVIANKIDRQRFFNSLTLTEAIKHDREITFSTLLPYGDYSALYNAGPGGVTVTAAFTNGANTLTFSLVAVAFPRISPTIPGRSEIMVPIEGQAFKSGSTLELVTTL